MGDVGALVPPDVVIAAIAGEPRARDVLAEAYWPVAYRLAVAVLGRRGPDAEDAAQDATLALARGVARLGDPSRLKAWGAVIAIRSAQRVRRRRKESVQLDELRLASPAGSREELLDMEDALRSLSAELRVPLVLCVVFGYTSAEAGSILGVPDGTVRYRISRARELLRTALKRAPDDMPLEKRKNDAAVR
jgi:RNA polymerase sigma-70 factor (ECF subfamily)